jgi:hypothetical protein
VKLVRQQIVGSLLLALIVWIILLLRARHILFP